VLDRWSARSSGHRKRLLVARGQLLAGLASRGIPVVPFRCARLASSGGELIEIDLLVRRGDVAATSDLLVSNGLEPETALTAEQTRALLHTGSARRFVHRSGYVVSLQWDVEDWSIAHGPSVDDLWQRASRGDLAGVPCSTLDRADFLLLLSVRGTAKRWHRLAWIREVAEVMAETDAADVDAALLRATRHGARRALALGTSLAARLLGASVTPGLADAAREPSLRALRRGVLANLVADTRSLPGPWHIARFHVRSRERVRDKLRYAVRRATLPQPDDVAALPPRLVFLSYALSPWRRALRAGEQWIRRSRPSRGRKLARFGRTPAHVVDRMLALAGATAADTIFDLGCGDGAIVIRAAERIGCRGVGIDVDETLLETARARARAVGVDRLIEFRHGDVREMDLTAATLVCVYLNAAANLSLRPLLQHGLRPGARLVSFNFAMGDWWPDDVEVLDETSWGSNTLYLWHIPPEPARESVA
jgi:hypothetical protein